MKCYLQDFGRPSGLEPTVYLRKPAENDNNPFGPTIVECLCIYEAVQMILDYSDDEEYLSKIKVVK